MFFIVNMCVSGRPTGKHTYLRRNQGSRRAAPDIGATVGRREITHVAPEVLIFVEDFRYLEDPGGGGPVGASRAFSDKEFRRRSNRR